MRPSTFADHDAHSGCPTARDDGSWMERAVELAAKGRFRAAPNPVVGAVVLDAEGKLIGEGYHTHFGGPHAEVVALEMAGEQAQGGCLYVTLEPCTHHGKTPPCVEAILTAAPRRVVIATPDPNPIARGGAEILQAEGIDVSVGVGEEGARYVNRRWLGWVEKKRPWVTLKAGISIDGRIATHDGQSQWITGTEARHRALELREEHDSILVGIGTVLADDPQLTRRLGLAADDRWLRIILDSNLRTPVDATVVTSEPESTLIVHNRNADSARRNTLEAAGVRLLAVDADDGGRPLITAVLDFLATEEITSLLVEGGSAIHGAFLDADLFDEVDLLIAPMIIGGKGLAVIGGRGVDDLAKAPRLSFTDVARHGNDIELIAIRREDDSVHGVG